MPDFDSFIFLSPQLHLRSQLLQDFSQMKLQIAYILLIFPFRDRSRLLPFFKARNLIQKLVFPVDQFVASLPAGQGFFMQLKRVADTPQEERPHRKNNKPGVCTHGIGYVGSLGAAIGLREEQ